MKNKFNVTYAFDLSTYSQLASNLNSREDFFHLGKGLCDCQMMGGKAIPFREKMTSNKTHKQRQIVTQQERKICCKNHKIFKVLQRN